MIRCKYIILFLVLSCSVFSQTSRKPSLYEYRSRLNYEGKWEELTQPKTKITSLARINSRNEFNLLNRVFDKGTTYEIPHLIFVIDRNANHVYYVNSPLFPYHEDFIRYLLKNNNLSREIINENYKAPTRQYIFGTLSWLKQENCYVYEFWEGDQLTKELLKYTEQTITNSFYDSIILKTNSTLQEQLAKSSNIEFITQEQVIKGQEYIALNKGKAKGKLRIIESVEGTHDISENDIVLLKENPISIPPVAGVISERPSTILSHVNILTRGWNVPNVYLKDASIKLAEYNNKYVEFDANQKNYAITLLDKIPKTGNRSKQIIELPDITVTHLFKLKDLDTSYSRYCGAKAANLGEINGRIKNVIIPDGFSIPFGQYHKFITKNGLYKKLRKIENSDEFKNNIHTRKLELEKLRKEIVNWKVDEKTVAGWKKQWDKQLMEKGVFVRSSSNSEDLPNFSGAGLYTTVPNVRNPEDLEMAVKTVWASVFNYEAYEARRYAGIPQDGVMMSVFIQEAIDSDCSGVMITQDPYDASRNYITYIAAKRGIGIKVVEGKRVAEQVMHSSLTKSIQRLSKSGETTELRLQKEGGVKEITIKNNKVVLTDDRIERLAKVGSEIKYLFGYREQDIEWAIKDDKIIILQARPYIH